MHLTLQQLRIFEAVARNLSFTRASEELYLTQPAISIQVKRLEENAGHPLFEQVGKKLFLTGAGEEMLKACRDVLGRLDDLDNALQDQHQQVRGPLTISAVTTSKYFMPHLLGPFLREYPEVEPRLNVTNRAKVLVRLKDNMDDLVIMGQVPEGLDLSYHPFINNSLVVVAAPDHPLARESQPIALERMTQERFLIREEGSGTRSAVDRLFAAQGLRINPYMELGSEEAIKQGAMAGIGVSVISSLSFRLEMTAGLLAVLNVEGFPLIRPWHCVYPKGKRLSRTGQVFQEFLLSRGAELLGASHFSV
ncbi:MAG: LysR family transcriptional regulator [Gammaproteobacteria bacterium]|nr:LysR family transcriptional regulator [Gammaproteobacteria bacterium]